MSQHYHLHYVQRRQPYIRTPCRELRTSYSEGRGVCGLVVAIEGECTYVFRNGTEMKISTGQAALFSDKIAYTLINRNTVPFAHYTINFHLSPGTELESDILINLVDFADFSKKCNTLLNFWNSRKPSSDLRSIAVLYELIADVLENNIINNVGKRAYRTVLPAIHYIDNNFEKKITIDELSRLCVMSNTNFRRIFTAVCGVSPIQYLLNVRLRRAKDYLSHTKFSVDEIAQKCGFNDVEYFCRIFKKRTRISPGKYRSKITNNCY